MAIVVVKYGLVPVSSPLHLTAKHGPLLVLPITFDGGKTGFTQPVHILFQCRALELRSLIHAALSLANSCQRDVLAQHFFGASDNVLHPPFVLHIIERWRGSP